MEVQKKAMDLAMENSRRLGLEVNFILQDIREHNHPEGLSYLDLIVSNPPYIPLREKGSMDANVLDYEPASALFVPDEDPLVYYRHIARYCIQALRPGGMLYLEIHEDFGKRVFELLENEKFERIELRKDINGKDRMIKASLSSSH